MKKLLCVLALLALVGCQSHSGGRPTGSIKSSVRPSTDQEYVANAIYAIQSQFYDADNFKGRECNLRLHQAFNEMPDSVMADGGDPKLCEAAITATKQAIDYGSFPYKPASSKLPDSIPFKIAPH